MTSHHRNRFITGAAVPERPDASEGPLVTGRGLLPNAATRELSSALSPETRRVDDKARIHHPPLRDLPGWADGCACNVVVDGCYLRVTPATGPKPDQGRFDGRTRLRIPAARLLAIGVAPGEDVAVVCDRVTGTVTVTAAAVLADVFTAIGELDELRGQVAELTAARDAAMARAAAAENRSDVLTELFDGRRSPERSTPLAGTGT